MAKALAITAGLLAACLAGCSPFGGGSAFSCETDTQCNANAGGRCESNGLCSYTDAECPSGQRYGDNAGGNSGRCVGDEVPPDGGIDSDMMSAKVCYGVGLVKPCFPAAPTREVTLPAEINTDTSDRCATDVTEADGFCVIAGERILVEESVAVSGSKPLVLVANSTIEISATLDAASHISGPNPPYTTKSGPGSGPAACGAGTPPANGGAGGGGGGGAGGTFGGSGGVGGGAPDGGAGGMPAATQPVTAFRGGCPGQDGIRGQTFGKGGRGGGAVYLIANTSITISSTLNASGEGGHPGTTGSAGAGGGGSGGMIGLDSPMIINSGAVFANGGSGGEGASETGRGNPGPEANSAAAAPPPSGATAIGGDGGGGGAGGSAAGTPEGAPGLAGTSGGGGADGGGGGGGGGTGVIKVYRGTLTGNFSPTPTP